MTSVLINIDSSAHRGMSCVDWPDAATSQELLEAGERVTLVHTRTLGSILWTKQEKQENGFSMSIQSFCERTGFIAVFSNVFIIYFV